MGQKDLALPVAQFANSICTSIKINQTVEEALKSVRENRLEGKIFYLYVVDEENKLKGVVSMRDLIINPLTQKIQNIFDEKVVSISAEQTLEHALEKLASHRLLALPVVNREKKLVGAIDVGLYLDEAIDMGRAKTSQTDLFHVLGIHLEQGRASLWDSYRRRMPWIFCNMFGGIACAVISKIFEIVLLEVIILAMFIPLVLSLSESISMQSMTYSLHMLQHGKAALGKFSKKLIRETKMLVFIALTCGIIIGFLSLLWQNPPRAAIAIGLGMICSIVTSGIVGATIPLFLHKYKLDPKVAAGPIVLMWADITTTTLYLSFASWLLLI